MNVSKIGMNVMNVSQVVRDDHIERVQDRYDHNERIQDS